MKAQIKKYQNPDAIIYFNMIDGGCGAKPLLFDLNFSLFARTDKTSQISKSSSTPLTSTSTFKSGKISPNVYHV
ncbi:MAG: hypothetical protein ABI597_06475 [Gammaproteobacteria bacterium]